MLDKILCVDDDPITLMLCRKVVEKVEFAKEILTAENGQEAIQYFDMLCEEIKTNDSISYPKLVLLDLNMPVMDGW
ncbi:MAG TPA: response regulator, partial [Flavobacterium sp.]|uniref:response regulator n=1 Tax=Flavobacterium sp. TaxID=239 RepID=UPI002CF2A321